MMGMGWWEWGHDGVDRLWHIPHPCSPFLLSNTLSCPASSAQCWRMARLPDVMAADTELFLTCELLCLCSSRVAAVLEDETWV